MNIYKSNHKWKDLSIERRRFKTFMNREGKLFKSRLFYEQDGKCKTCNMEMIMPSPEKMNQKNIATIDHIINLKDGGTNEKSNLRLICKQCNDLKNQSQSGDMFFNIPLSEIVDL